MKAGQIKLVVESDHVGLRIDSFLARQLPELSRARIQGLIESGDIKSSKGLLKSSHRLSVGEEITVEVPAPAPTHMQAQDLALEVLYEDADLVVINKPAGLVVHPGAGHVSGTLANALLHRYPDMHVGDSKRPGLVHRLDKETSGVMVCARNDKSFAALTAQFKSRQVTKLYRAFCYGRIKSNSFELITGHSRHKSDRKRFTTKLKAPLETGKGVRLAHSRFELLQSYGGVSEVKVEIFTGRTHQIRAHLADINHPLLHDPLYGGGAQRIKHLPQGVVKETVTKLGRHALHAERLSFSHPSSHESLTFNAELPCDLRAIHEAMTVLSQTYETR